MKLILDTVTANQTTRKPSRGASSVPIGNLLAGSGSRAIFGIPLQSPSSDRGRSSVRARNVAAPAPGPGDVLHKRISRLDEANREWSIWRFGDDA